MTTTQPANDTPTDEQTIRAVLEAVLQGFRDMTDPRVIPQIVGDGLRRVLEGERKRCAALAIGIQEQALASEAHARAAGSPAAAATSRNAAVVAQGIAAMIVRPPGPVCSTCGGGRMVRSRVVLPGGLRGAMPCPACTEEAQAASPKADA